MNLLKTLLASLAENKLTTPTEIQKKAIPALLEGRSVVGVSETGSGKTLSYALPVLNMVKTLENDKDPVTQDSQPRAIIVVPTRELGEQVAKVFKPFAHTTRVRIRSVLGGTPLEMSRRNVAGVFEILVATPGRLVQLMDIGKISLVDVRMLVFDEADQMLDQGFLPDAEKIAEECPPERQLALFSATVSPKVQELMNEMFAEAEVIRSKGSNKLVSTLKTSNRNVVDGRRFPLLEKILEKPVPGGTIIFTNTREQCDIVADLVKKSGRKCLIYRGEMDKVERRNNLKSFRKGEIELLISTDLAARGLDIDHVGRVINYHLPKQMDNYMHRVGRTARAGKEGLVVNMVTERDAPLMAKLAKMESNKGSAPKTDEKEDFKSAAKSAGKPAFKPAAKPAFKSEFKKATKPGAKPSGKPAAKSDRKMNPFAKKRKPTRAK